ncbi:MAG TPA: thiamine-phosphate kinase [Ornithinibacter sp.]|nr:thiamine-phosphate kinase [Ornithinibacter sp.]
MRLRDSSEGDLLAQIFPLYAGTLPPEWGSVPVGPGDDAAVVGAPGGSVVATTDSMVRGLDWRDEWSSAHDVGVKVAAQNLADIAAMGAEPTALLVSLAADPDLEVAWAVDLARGIASLAHRAGAPVVGGDLSGAPPGVVVVSVTALGDLRGLAPVLRSGARPGDVVAVCGTLGWSGAGLALFERGEGAVTTREDDDHDDDRADTEPGSEPDAGSPRAAAVLALLGHHRAPVPPWRAGPRAAAAGAHALIDVSDGLVTDLGRVARASGVQVDLEASVLRDHFAEGPLTLALGPADAWHQVLTGGEEHSLVGTFADEVSLPRDTEHPWMVIGRVLPVGTGGPRVTVDGVVPDDARGWDHFAR